LEFGQSGICQGNFQKGFLRLKKFLSNLGGGFDLWLGKANLGVNIPKLGSGAWGVLENGKANLRPNL